LKDDFAKSPKCCRNCNVNALAACQRKRIFAKYPPSTLTRNLLSANFFAPWATNTFVVGPRPAQRAGRYNGYAKFLFFETFGKAILKQKKCNLPN
jgi:hypothetical protein